MRKISHNTYLQALGLFTLGQSHAKKTEECREELEKLLEADHYGHISDALYESDGNMRDFDAALTLEGIEVEKN
jgi:hypothetical protein